MIKGPKNAVPTLRGWVAPNGELLKAQKITQAQIDEWNGVTVQDAAPVVEVVEAVVEPQEQESVEAGTEDTTEVVEEQVEAPKPKRRSKKENKFAAAINRAKSKLGR